VLSRPPHPDESERLVKLLEASREKLSGDPEKAKALATAPLGPAPEGADLVELAALTVVGNVLLNLDEAVMKK